MVSQRQPKKRSPDGWGWTAGTKDFVDRIVRPVMSRRDFCIPLFIPSKCFLWFPPMAVEVAR
jgi:hypothetical protein